MKLFEIIAHDFAPLCDNFLASHHDGKLYAFSANVIFDFNDSNYIQ